MTALGSCVVLGIASQVPVAGVLWQTAHYLEGLRRLGYDVYYVEDHGYWPYDPYAQTITDECAGSVRFISELMARLGLQRRWAYRDVPSGRVYGMREARLEQLFRSADVLLNLTASTALRECHMEVPIRIYLETDPVMAQIGVAKQNPEVLGLLECHTHHATYGENLGGADCGVPVGVFSYIPTRPPVILEWWRPGRADDNAPYTTVTAWKQTYKDLDWNGERYTWSKDVEFLKVLDLPSRSPRRLELAVAGATNSAQALLRAHGWSLRDAQPISASRGLYREYIRGSWGEFTVAKDQNVRLRSGWFSDRSACYLAAGRPVVTQDTGFPNILPTGKGLFAFRDLDDIGAAFDEVEADPARQRSAARGIAEEYFRAERVLERLMESLATSGTA